MAIDSESVAYIPPKVGTNEKAAAIVQVATKDYVVIFVVHEWLALYDSFKAFLESDVEKVALNISHDTAAINAKFPEIRLEAKTHEEKQAHRRETREADNERRRKRRREERERKARPPDGGAALDADADRDAGAAPN